MDRYILVRIVRRVGFLVLLVALLAPILPAQVVGAPPRHVTNCGPSGTGSLAQAVTDANSGSNDTIVFDLDCQDIVPGTSTTPGKIVPSGPLTLTQSMTVDGTGRTIVVDGNNAQSVFVVNSGVTVTLKGLTIQNGNGARGGGVDNEGGTLTVSNSTLSGNTTSGFGGTGGGIFNRAGGTLMVSNSPDGTGAVEFE